MQPNNPAGRLLRLIQEMRSVPEKDGGSWYVTKKAWAQILGASNESQVLSHLSRIMRLPAQVEAIVKQSGDLDEQLYLSWVKPVSLALTHMNFDAAWKDVKNRIDPVSVKALEFCNHELSRNNPEPIIDLGELNTLESQVRALSDEILGDNSIPLNLKNFMLRHLQAIEDSVIDYRYFGVSAVRDSVSKVLGELTLNRFIDPESNLHDEIKRHEAGKKFWDVMGKAAILSAVIDKGQQLLESDIVQALLN